MPSAITPQDVNAAAAELARMRASLSSWLRYRSLNDRVLAGTARVRKPMSYAQRVVAARRDMSIEQDLATKLNALLRVVLPGQPLPDSNMATNPMAAVQLAQLAIMGGTAVSSPTATGGILSASSASHPWLWPVLIVGGVVVLVVTAIKTAADVAKDQEEKACIEAGACTDYGFWAKAGGLALLAWLAWEKFGLRNMVKKGGS